MGRRVCGERNESAGKRKEGAQGQDEPGRAGASEEEGCDRGKKKRPMGIGDHGREGGRKCKRVARANRWPKGDQMRVAQDDQATGPLERWP